MTDRVIILAMLTGAWLVGAWGTFAFVKVRRARRLKASRPAEREARVVALYVAARGGAPTPQTSYVYYPVGRTRATRLDTPDRADNEGRKDQLRVFARRQSIG